MKSKFTSTKACKIAVWVALGGECMKNDDLFACKMNHSLLIMSALRLRCRHDYHMIVILHHFVFQ
jgi:hypothetical protein